MSKTNTTITHKRSRVSEASLENIKDGQVVYDISSPSSGIYIGQYNEETDSVDVISLSSSSPIQPGSGENSAQQNCISEFLYHEGQEDERIIEVPSSTSATGDNSMAAGIGTLASGQGAYAEGHIAVTNDHIVHHNLWRYTIEGYEDNGYFVPTGETRSTDEDTKYLFNVYHFDDEMVTAGYSDNEFPQVGDSVYLIEDDKFVFHPEISIIESGEDEWEQTLTRTEASGRGAHAEGCGTYASDTGAHAEGYNTKATRGAAHAEGELTEANGYHSHAEGYQSIATGTSSHVEGQETKALKDNGHAEGDRSEAQGIASHAEGRVAKAIGNISHAEGYYSEARNEYSHAEGYQTIAEGNRSHAEGNKTQTSATAAHSEGESTLSNQKAGHAEGYQSVVTNDKADRKTGTDNNDKVYGHAEGDSTCVSAHAGHAEGLNSLCDGKYGHAEGWNTEVWNAAGHAEGHNTLAGNDDNWMSVPKTDTQPEGWFTHAEGDATNARGFASHAEGLCTKTINIAEHAQGMWNMSNSSTISSTGIGTSNSNRKNAFEIDKDGYIYMYGVGIDSNAYNGTNPMPGINDIATYINKLLNNM